MKIKQKFRYLAAFITGLGVTLIMGLITLLCLSEAGVITLLGNETRTYSAEYYNDGALVYSQIMRRGDDLTYGNDEETKPTRSMDADGTKYTFIGWDFTGDGIPDPDIVKAYFNFKANAVYIPFDLEHLVEDLMNKVDLTQLYQLLMEMDIDIEAFLNMLGLDPSMLEQLMEIPVLEYTTDFNGLMYFRTKSCGDYNSSRKKWLDSDYYPVSNISSGSVNPLDFATDKIKALMDVVQPGSGFPYDVAIDYKMPGDKYPVPNFEVGNKQGLNSDSFSLTAPIGMHYETRFEYAYAQASTIAIARRYRFSSDAITRDEQNYQKYARDHYLNVESKYKDFFLEEASRLGIKSYTDGSADFKFIEQVRQHFVDHFQFNITMEQIPSNEDPIFYFNKTSHNGSSQHFATSTTLMFRSLGIPARYVQGYADMNDTPGEPNMVPLLLQHAWCEVYVNDLGWIPVDPGIEALANGSSENLYGQEDSDFNNSIEEGYGGQSGNVSTSVSTKGSGAKGNTGTYFTFRSNYKGTAYFRVNSYNTFMPDEAVWQQSSDDDFRSLSSYGIKDSPLIYTSVAAENLFEKYDFRITYKKKYDYGPVPIYATDTYLNDYSIRDNYSKGKTEVDEKLSTYAYSISPTKNNISLLKKNLERNSELRTQCLAYSVYAKERYLDVATKYKTYFSKLAEQNNIKSSDEDVINEVASLIHKSAKYNIDFEEYPKGEDPILYFMQTAKEGVCNNFASAAVMMYRTLGIPARFVVGFGANSVLAKECVVTGETAHAWTEVFVNGVGWIAVDATNFMDGHGDNDGLGNDGEGGFQGQGFGGGGYGEEIEELTASVKLSTNFDSQKIDADSKTIQISKTYDANEFQFNLTENQKSSSGVGLIGEDKVVLDVETDWRYVGGYSKNVYFKIHDGNGEDVTDQYAHLNITDSSSNSVTLDIGDDGRFKMRLEAEILPRDLEVTTESKDWPQSDVKGEMKWETYSCSYAQYDSTEVTPDIGYEEGYDDGAPTTNSTVEISRNANPINSEGLCYHRDRIDNVDFTASLTDIGYMTNSIDEETFSIINDEYVDVTECYNVTFNYGTISIIRD